MSDALKQARDAQIDAAIEAWFTTPITAAEGEDRGHPFRSRMRAAIAAADAAIARADAAPRDDGMPASADERHLRRLLAIRVGMPHTYTDDGEANGQQHDIAIDFMREPVADIDAKLRALNVARAECADAAQATPVAGWISVDDSLPPKFTEVLIAFAGQNTLASTGQWTDNHKHDVRGWCYPAENRGCTDGGDDPVVTHWMPLPDVPLTPRCDKPAAPPAPAAQQEPAQAVPFTGAQTAATTLVRVLVEPAQAEPPPDGFELLWVRNLGPLLDALDRAEEKGYLPDAMADQWAAFEFRQAKPAGGA